jgi:hypothetical protein
MVTPREVELLARAYSYILSDAWGKLTETAGSENFDQDTDPAESGQPIKTDCVVIVPSQEGISNEKTN